LLCFANQVAPSRQERDHSRYVTDGFPVRKMTFFVGRGLLYV